MSHKSRWLVLGSRSGLPRLKSQRGAMGLTWGSVEPVQAHGGIGRDSFWQL